MGSNVRFQLTAVKCMTDQRTHRPHIISLDPLISSSQLKLQYMHDPLGTIITTYHIPKVSTGENSKKPKLFTIPMGLISCFLFSIYKLTNVCVWYSFAIDSFLGVCVPGSNFICVRFHRNYHECWCYRNNRSSHFIHQMDI